VGALPTFHLQGIFRWSLPLIQEPMRPALMHHGKPRAVNAYSVLQGNILRPLKALLKLHVFRAPSCRGMPSTPVKMVFLAAGHVNATTFPMELLACRAPSCLRMPTTLLKMAVLAETGHVDKTTSPMVPLVCHAQASCRGMPTTPVKMVFPAAGHVSATTFPMELLVWRAPTSQ
jgi:hypothetical protein